MVPLANYLFRALYLLGLAVAPRVFSPDPAPRDNAVLALVGSAAALATLLLCAQQLKKRLESREATVAAALIWVAVAGALGASVYFSGPEAPLARGAAPLALLVWPALAATAAALAGRFLGANWKHKRTAAAAAVLAGGIFVHADGAKNMGDRAFMWRTALRREPGNERAFEEVSRGLLAQGKLADAAKITEACLKANPRACACHVAAGNAARRSGDQAKAVAAGAEAAKACPMNTRARALNAEILASAGKLEEAMVEADAAIALNQDAARAHAAKATVLLASGKVKEAEEEAGKAVQGEGDRDAVLVVVAMKINGGDLDGAETLLKALASNHPNDADITYNLALIADKRNRYNDARNGYLTALKLNPAYKEARYNLAMLTWRRGVIDEAKNHAKKFVEMAPNDPAGQALTQLMATKDAPKQ
ncbi:MAG: tetratricopeptide repeat protein [Polyangiaceae bacterium]|nr:tetratricopeptide repeat protein [Polyangiaceae bacterium]